MAGSDITIDIHNGYIDQLLENNNDTSSVDSPKGYIDQLLENNNDTSSVDSLKVCPLCGSGIRLFFINYNEKFLMCENVECDYPFGYVDLQYVKVIKDMPSDYEEDPLATDCPSPISSQTSSMVTNTASADMENMQRANESEDTQSDRYFVAKEKQKFMTVAEKTIMNNLNQIMKLNQEIVALDETTSEHRKIKNEKWIQNLQAMQELSGMQLLKPDEINLAKREQPNIGLGELKIDITPGTANTLSMINIALDETSNKTVEELPMSQIFNIDNGNYMNQ